MMRIRLIIAASFIIMSIPLNGQTKGQIKTDTTRCEEYYHKLKLNDKKVIAALNGAEKYINKILGSNIIQNNIQLDYCMSNESGFQLYNKDIKQLRRIGEDTCYELHYFVLDKTNTIGYFQLLVDRNGNPMEYNYPSDEFNHPELIRGFKKHFDNQFKFSYSQAVALGEKKGFWEKPYLQCKTENNLISNRNGEVFIKVKYYWAFYQVWDGGHQAFLEINAETGVIEKEIYIPRMPG